MNRPNRARLAAALAASFLLVGCSDQSVVAPASNEALRFAVQGVAGSYVISFLIEAPGGLVSVADGQAVPLGSYLVLKSEVRDNVGNLAQSGTVTYEYCWAKGNYAPTATCNSGAGSWRRLRSMPIDPVGQLAGFGSCSTARSIGFRFTYSGKGSGIASGVSIAKDFTWAAI